MKASFPDYRVLKTDLHGTIVSEQRMRYLDADEPSNLPPIRAVRISRRAATAGPDAGRAPENENQTDSLLPESALENPLQPKLPYRHRRDRLGPHRNRRGRLQGHGGTVRPD